MFKTITDEALKAALQIVRPLQTYKDRLHWLALSDPRNEAFTWEENMIGYASNLQEHRQVETWHTFGFYGFFKPTLAECLAHLTDDDIANGVCGVECRIIDHDNWKQTLVEHEGKQLHRGITIFYKPLDTESTGKGETMKSDLYRPLKGGEIIQVGDEYDGCNDPWKCDPVWVEVHDGSPMVGSAVPDPAFPAHTRYRRKLNDAEYAEWCEIWGK